jgi:hypothetical protein
MTKKKAITPSKKDIDAASQIITDIIKTIMNANISDMNDDKATDLFITSVIDVIYPEGDSSLYKDVKNASKKEISFLIPSIKKIFREKGSKSKSLLINTPSRRTRRTSKMRGLRRRHDTPHRHSNTARIGLHLGGQRREIYDLLMILLAVQVLIMNEDNYNGIEDLARPFGLGDFAAAFDRISYYIVGFGLIIIAGHVIHHMRQPPIVVPSIANATHIGRIDILAKDLDINSISHDDFKEGEEVVILERIRGMPPHTSMFKIEGIEGWIEAKRLRNEPPTNPKTQHIITQADIERATLHIKES